MFYHKGRNSEPLVLYTKSLNHIYTEELRTRMDLELFTNQKNKNVKFFVYGTIDLIMAKGIDFHPRLSENILAIIDSFPRSTDTV